MQHQEETKAVYEAILNVAHETTKVLNSISEQVKVALDSALQQHYQTNKALLHLASKNAMNPILAQNAAPDVKPQIEALQSLHRDISSQNEKIQKMQAELTLLGQNTPNSEFAKQLALGQEKLLGLSYKSNELAIKAQKEFNVLLALTGDPNNASPEALAKSKDTISNIINQINENNNTIKVTLKEQSKLVNSATPNAAKQEAAPEVAPDKPSPPKGP